MIWRGFEFHSKPYLRNKLAFHYSDFAVDCRTTNFGYTFIAFGWCSLEAGYRFSEMNSFSNTTVNFTSSGSGTKCGVYTVTTFSKVSETIGYLLVLIFGVIGNSLVVAIVYRNRSMRTPANYFIANMAFADLMVPIFLVPKNLVWVYHGKNVWLIGGTFGEFLCKFIPFIHDVCLMVSIHSLVLVAVERFYAVMRPLRAAIRSTRRCVVIIVSIWVLAMLFHGSYFYVHRLFFFKEKFRCYMTWEPLDDKTTVEKIYISIIVIFYAFPLISITTLYCIIILKLKRQRIPGTRYGHMIINRQKRIVNTFRMVMTVVLAFFICWTPSIIFTSMLFFHWDWVVPCDLLFHAELIVYMIAFSNNAITPYIYFIFNENYKNGLKALLPWYEKARTVGYPRGHLTHSTNSSLRSAAMTTRISFKNSMEQIAEPSVLEQPTARNLFPWTKNTKLSRELQKIRFVRTGGKLPHLGKKYNLLASDVYKMDSDWHTIFLDRFLQPTNPREVDISY